MGVAEGLIISALIGAGSSAYAANEAEDQAEKARKEQEKQRIAAEKEAERVAMAQRPDEEKATIKFGGEDDGEVGSTNDFLTPLNMGKSSLGATDSSSGLGFGV